MLPPEYGGTGSSVDDLTKYWMEQVTFFWVSFGPLWYFFGIGSSDEILDGTGDFFGYFLALCGTFLVLDPQLIMIDYEKIRLS